MMDREIVIKGCENWVNNHKGEDLLITYSSVVELLELLKEQKPVEPIKPIDVDDSFTYLCSNCKGELFCGDRIRDKYCSTCGRLVKWNDRS